MSNSPVIPKEKLSAYQRWELHSFDDVPRAKTGPGSAADKVTSLHDRAYQEGLAEGLRRGTLQAANDASTLHAVLANLRQQCEQISQHAAEDVLKLALEVARQMVRQVLKVRPAAVIPVVQDALARIAQTAAPASLNLHPDDARLVRERLGEQLAATGWIVIEDAQIARGGCKLNTAGCLVDASVATRWQRLAAVLGESGEWLE